VVFAAAAANVKFEKSTADVISAVKDDNDLYPAVETLVEIANMGVEHVPPPQRVCY
jgi:hypothetical protein